MRTLYRAGVDRKPNDYRSRDTDAPSKFVRRSGWCAVITSRMRHAFRVEGVGVRRTHIGMPVLDLSIDVGAVIGPMVPWVQGRRMALTTVVKPLPD
jgi:hypothetical protein